MLESAGSFGFRRAIAVGGRSPRRARTLWLSLLAKKQQHRMTSTVQLAPKRMSLAFEDDHVRLTLEVAPGGEAVRVVLMSKRFERLQAARARAA